MILRDIATFYILFIVCCLNAYKILVVFPFPATSMNSLGHAIVKHLTSAGHEVTYMTAHLIPNPRIKNLRQIELSKNKESFKELDIFRIDNIMDNTRAHPSIRMYMATQETGINAAEAVFSNSDVEKILKNSDETFDVVIADLFETEIYSALSALYDCPMIWSYSMNPHWFALRLIDEATNVAYTVDYYSNKFPSQSILQKLKEFIARGVWTFLNRLYILPRELAIYEKVFTPLIEARRQNVPQYTELIYNASFIFSNDYINPSTPTLPQNCKLIGGYHIQNPPDRLPTELEYLFNKTNHGIIYFSMGSNWQSKSIPQNVVKKLLKVFGELKQTILWKYEEDLLNVPDNVYIMKWVPQHSVLAHPKCIMFISHCGQLSIMEANNFGVPVIGIPIDYDQLTNVDTAVQLGYAIKVNLDRNLPESLKIAINEMLQDPKYSRKAKEICEIFHDRPVPPGKELVHWVEHVIRTRGALHLRSPARLIPWYQKIHLDLAIVLVVFSTLCFFIISKIKNKTKKTFLPQEERKKKII